MRMIYLKLINYIGIYNGLGLNEIEIDFSKCKHRNVVIRGENGSGKSTIFNSAHMLPDKNNCFIPNLKAEKHFYIIDNDIIYKFRLVHGVKNNGDRESAKAYMTKCYIYTNEEQEMNPNGNITSFLDLLYSEFKLDPNFISLSELSSEHRGLADKTPTERKKFVTSIIESLEVYNNIHKVLTKRASVFKSMINSLLSKIDSIGDEEKVRLCLQSIEQRLNNLIDNKNGLIEQLASYKSKIQLLDPDCSIQNAYNEIYNQLKTLNDIYTDLSTKIDSIYVKLNLDINISYEEVLSKYNTLKNNIIKLDSDIQFEENTINSLLLDRENEYKSIQIKTERLNSLQDNKNFSDIDKSLKMSKQKLIQYETILNEIGLENIFNISKDEFIMGLNTIKEIKETIDIFRANSDYHLIELSIPFVLNNSYPDVDKLSTNIDNLNNIIYDLEAKLQYYSILQSVASKLEMRPDNCCIDSCQFIKDSLEAIKEEPGQNIDIIQKSLDNYRKELADACFDLDINRKLIEYINNLKVIIRTIEKNSIILNKLPIKNIFLDKELLLNKILNGYSFEEFDILYNHLQNANIIEEYKTELYIYNSLESDYKLYESKSDIINDILNEIDNLNSKLNNISNSIQTKNDNIFQYKKLLSDYKSLVLDYEVLLSLLDERQTLDRNKSELISKYNNIRNNITIIKECINNIELTEKSIQSIDEQIKPMMSERDKLKHGLIMLEEYKVELAEYNAKYEKIETIRKYCNPNKGISTIYMELYMNKTLSIANELLEILYDGVYVLQQYEINENEFRIPCMGKGLANSDISDMSTSEICLISMIVSFSLLQQSSTRYNILKLDEIDGGLDTLNRLRFLTVLEKVSDLMEVEQLLMISHNTELDTSNCDLILLKLPESERNIPGNVIYSYAA